MDQETEKRLSDIVQSVKFIVKDMRQLSEQTRNLETALTQIHQPEESVSDRLTSIEADLANTRDRLLKAEELRASGVVPVSPAIATSSAHEPDQLLDLPLAKVLDLYGEVPQVLVPYCRRAVINREQNQAPPLLERNAQGNYWVLQLRDQGLLLLPRPGAFNRLVALESLRDLFEYTGELRGDGTDEFCVVEPARLSLIKRHQRWQLEAKGRLQFGVAPLEYRWRQQLQKIETHYNAILQSLETQGVSSLRSVIAADRDAQQLQQRYGPVRRIFINTCMPMAYALYRDQAEQAHLVPCSLQTVHPVRVFPAWDIGVSWQATLFASAHSAESSDVVILRASVNHPVLPGQAFLRDGSEQTWAIANSYEEASTLLEKLIDHWGPLFEPS